MFCNVLCTRKESKCFEIWLFSVLWYSSMCVCARAYLCVWERARELRVWCQSLLLPKKEIIHKLETYELRMNVWVCIYGDSCSFWYMNNGSLKWTHEQKFSHFCRMKNWSILLEQEFDGVGRGKKDRVKRRERESKKTACTCTIDDNNNNNN